MSDVRRYIHLFDITTLYATFFLKRLCYFMLLSQTMKNILLIFLRIYLFLLIIIFFSQLNHRERENARKQVTKSRISIVAGRVGVWHLNHCATCRPRLTNSKQTISSFQGKKGQDCFLFRSALLCSNFVKHLVKMFTI